MIVVMCVSNTVRCFGCRHFYLNPSLNTAVHEASTASDVSVYSCSNQWLVILLVIISNYQNCYIIFKCWKFFFLF